MDKKAGSAGPRETGQDAEDCQGAQVVRQVVSMDVLKEGVVRAKSENLAGNRSVLLTRPSCPAFCHRSDLTSTSELRQAL